MERMKTRIILLFIVLLSSCHVFLGPDPDSSPEGIFDRLWNDFNEIYALFDIKKINWDKTYQLYSQRISPDMNDYELFFVCAEMLNSLNDYHSSLFSPFGASYSLNSDNVSYQYLRYDREPFDLEIVKSYLYNGEHAIIDNEMFLYGMFKPDISGAAVGYIHIKSFLNSSKIESDTTQAWVKEINGIVQSLSSAEGIVLDLRNNSGGLGSNMEYIAERFVSAQKDYMKSSTKNGPGRDDFSDPVTWTIKPAGSPYVKPVVLLTNWQTVSAGEWFVMAMRTQDHITHAGSATRGAFSARVVRPLINGWTYTISIQKVAAMNGTYYEGIGITPAEQHRVINARFDLVNNADLQLDYALNLFNAAPP